MTKIDLVTELAAKQAEIEKYAAALDTTKYQITNEDISTIVAVTIERCAKAVWDAGGDNVEFHVAAIRALQDKP